MIILNIAFRRILLETVTKLMTFQLRTFFFLITFVIGFIHAWATRYTMDSDGISYLDMGDAFFSGDWKSVINGYWSPLYPLVQGFFLHIFKPPSYWESTVVHFINFIIYLISFICFDFFLHQLIQCHKQKEKELSSRKLILLPEWAWLSLGYSLFIWSSMNLVGISLVTPDMLVAGIVYFATGILFKIKRENKNWFWSIILGITLGLSYLAKALLPMVFVYLVLVILAAYKKITLPKVLIALLVFLLISTPYIFVLSKFRGHLTFGDSAMLNYAWNINPTSTECWKSGFIGCGKLVHPVREIFNNPKVYEYSNPFTVTYPVWHDPSYWYQGLKPHFDLQTQIKVIGRSAKKYFNLFLYLQGALLCTWLILLFLSPRVLAYLKDLREEWLLLIPAIAALLIYSLANVELRYISAFFVLFWLGLFSALKFSDTKEIKKYSSYLIVALSAFMLVTSFFSRDLLENRINRIDGLDPKSYKMNISVAEGLKKEGIKEKDKVAVIGLYDEYYWARLIKVRIIAEIPTEEINNFWASGDSIKLQVLKAFKSAGVKAIVTGRVPDYVSRSGWKNIKDTPYYFYVL